MRDVLPSINPRAEAPNSKARKDSVAVLKLSGQYEDTLESGRHFTCHDASFCSAVQTHDVLHCVAKYVRGA